MEAIPKIKIYVLIIYRKNFVISKKSYIFATVLKEMIC